MPVWRMSSCTAERTPISWRNTSSTCGLIQDMLEICYCGCRADMEDLYSASKWRAPSSPFKQLTFLKSTSTSVGDVMRDLDGKHLITGDFIVVSGDVISNLPIEGALTKHRARREADKNAIMTMILREAGRNHRTKSSSVSPVFVIDPTKDRCLHYEEIDHHSPESSRLNIDAELITTHQEIDLRQDLIDCNIDICTPDVLSLWSDSFDYQTPRKQFLYGVLKDYELNGKTIHTHIVKDHYAARVRNLKAYDAVSKDVISRWAYPLCPDTNLLRGHNYELRKGSLYQEQGVTLARSCVIGRRTVIGQGTSIGDKTTVKNTVLGRDCKIGKNVTLDGAYIWDGAVIGDGTTVNQAIVADRAVVGKNCTIEPGSLISFGVEIADGVKVSDGRRITTAYREEDDEVPASEPEVVGEGGKGYEYVPYDDDEDEDETASNASSGLSKCILLHHFFESDWLTILSQFTIWRTCLSLQSLSRRFPPRSQNSAGLVRVVSVLQCPTTRTRTTLSTMPRRVSTTACGMASHPTWYNWSWSVCV